MLDARSKIDHYQIVVQQSVKGNRGMIVEFIGCTGSGKTTLISQIQSRLAKTTRVVTAHELVASRIGLVGVTNPTAQNLIQEVVGFPYCIRSLRRHRAFLGVTVQLFTRNSDLSFTTIHNLRSIERKIGVYEMTQRCDQDVIVLVDEGPIQAAHMFVFTRTALTPEEITQFANLLPLPDLIVYVRSPVDTLVERTLRRADPPRQMSSKHGTLREGYIRSAVALFEDLIQEASLWDRSLIVDTLDCTRPEYDNLVDGIAESILDRRKAVMRSRPANALSSAT
jgi:thymidylate kinase